MTTLPSAVPRRRHAFGWPAGSVRALLAIGVLGLLWVMPLYAMYVQKREPGQEVSLPPFFSYLQVLMVLILAHFFTAHGGSIRAQPEESSPLHLPRGTIRFLLLVGYVGLTYCLWKWKNQGALDFRLPSGNDFMLLTTCLLIAFFIGHVLTWLMRGRSGVLPFWFQDIQAWVALLAVIAMFLLVVVHGLINPTLLEKDQIRPISLENILGVLVGFYFGGRS
jgi:hypothetical protein